MSSHASTTAHDAVSTVVEYVFEKHPHIARRAGRHDFDGRIPVVAPYAVDELDGHLARVRRELDALPDSADPELRADLDAAAHILADERFPAAALGNTWPSPVSWLAATDVSDYPDPRYAPLADGMAALRTQLTALPPYLDEAAATISPRLAAGQRIIGIEHGRAQAVELTDLGRDVAAAHPEYADDIGAAATAAAEACLGYVDAIAATKPVNTLYGTEILDQFLREAQGLDQPVTELVERVAEEVAALSAALDRVAAKVGAATRDEAFALLEGEVTRGSVPDVLTAIIERLRQFWADADVLTVDTVVPLEVHSASRRTTSARVEFSISAPLATERLPHTLWVPEPAADPDAELSAVRRQYLNDPMLEVIAVHEAFAGHYVQIEATAQGPSVLRTCVPWFPSFTEGWAHYVEELAVEHGLADGRPLVEVAQLKSALEAATRLFVFLSVHMGRMSLGDAVTRTMALCGWSAERAAREVLIVAADPSGAMYTLGKLRIRDWRQRVKDGAKDFHDRLMRCGSAPLSTAWRYYLDGRDALELSGATS